MPFCPNCGRDVSEGASFCPSCGKAVTPPAAANGGMPPPQAPGPSAAAPPQQPPPPPPGTQQPYYTQTPAGAPPPHVPGVVPPPPKKKMGSGWKAAIIIGVIVILLMAGIGIFLGLVVFRAVKAPVDVTNRYIEAINDGDAQEAWDLLHADSPFKEEYTLSSFESSVVEVTIRLRSWNANEVDIRDSRAMVGVDMEDTSGEKFRIDFDLRKDGGDWKVYDYAYSDTGG